MRHHLWLLCTTLLVFQAEWSCAEGRAQSLKRYALFPGDVLLGVTLPLSTLRGNHTCGGGTVDMAGMQMLAAVEYSLKLANESLKLPFTLGAVVRDDCRNTEASRLCRPRLAKTSHSSVIKLRRTRSGFSHLQCLLGLCSSRWTTRWAS